MHQPREPIGNISIRPRNQSMLRRTTFESARSMPTVPAGIGAAAVKVDTEILAAYERSMHFPRVLVLTAGNEGRYNECKLHNLSVCRGSTVGLYIGIED